jgi:hypothetical protein
MKTLDKCKRGFALLQVILLLAVMAVLTGLLAPYGAAWYEAALLFRERSTLEQINAAVTRGFVSTETRENLSFFAGASFMPPDATLTTNAADFNYAGDPSFTLLPGTWCSKVGRAMGLNFPDGQIVTPDSGEVARAVVFNSVGRQRWLLIGPTGEPREQRYIVMSLMVSSEAGLTFPVNDGLADYFNEIYDNDWASPSARPPAGWAARLSPADYARWSEIDRGRTYASRLIVTRIRQSKFTERISNTHSVDWGWVDVGGVKPALTSAPGTGEAALSGILQGREVVFRRGDTGEGVRIISYPAVDNIVHTIQPGS